MIDDETLLVYRVIGVLNMFHTPERVAGLQQAVHGQCKLMSGMLLETSYALGRASRWHS